MAEHPALRAALERRCVDRLGVIEAVAPFAERWRETREVRFELFHLCSTERVGAETYRKALGLRRNPTRHWLSCFEDDELFVMADANHSVAWATSTDAAVRALAAGPPFGLRLRPRHRVVRPAPAAASTVISPRSSDGVTLARAGDGIELAIAWPRSGVTRSVVIAPATALADPRVARLPLTSRAREHALAHATLVDGPAEPPFTLAELTPLLGAPLARQYLALNAAWGHLAGDVRGPYFLPRGETDPIELWEATEFRSARDETCAAEASRPLLRLHWADAFRSGELAAYLDDAGRIWAQDYGARSDWLLLATTAQVYVERLVRALSCRWAPVGTHARPAERAVGLLGQAWADAHGCVAVPEASDDVMRLWESDAQVITEDRFSAETTRWVL